MDPKIVDIKRCNTQMYVAWNQNAQQNEAI